MHRGILAVGVLLDGISCHGHKPPTFAIVGGSQMSLAYPPLPNCVTSKLCLWLLSRLPLTFGRLMQHCHKDVGGQNSQKKSSCDLLKDRSGLTVTCITHTVTQGLHSANDGHQAAQQATWLHAGSHTCSSAHLTVRRQKWPCDAELPQELVSVHARYRLAS